MRPFAFESRWRDVVVASLLPGRAVRAGFWDDFVRDAPFVLQLGVRAGVFALWWGPLFFVGRARTFGGLDEAQRAELLARAASHPAHPVRQLVVPLKLAVAFGALEEP